MADEKREGTAPKGDAAKKTEASAPKGDSRIVESVGTAGGGGNDVDAREVEQAMSKAAAAAQARGESPEKVKEAMLTARQKVRDKGRSNPKKDLPGAKRDTGRKVGPGSGGGGGGGSKGDRG